MKKLGLKFLAIPAVAAVAVQLGLLMLLAAAPHEARAQAVPVSALTHFDESHITGTWYEIARYPAKKEKRCVSDAFELIALDDKTSRLQLVDSCKVKAGYTDARNLTAKAEDKKGDAEFKVSTFFPFSRKYWVLALAPDDTWAVLGSPNRKSLWIFSKTPTIGADVLAAIEAKTAAEGFVSNHLIFMPQIAANSSTQAPALMPAEDEKAQ